MPRQHRRVKCQRFFVDSRQLVGPLHKCSYHQCDVTTWWVYFFSCLPFCCPLFQSSNSREKICVTQLILLSFSCPAMANGQINCCWGWGEQAWSVMKDTVPLGYLFHQAGREYCNKHENSSKNIGSKYSREIKEGSTLLRNCQPSEISWQRGI